VLSWFINGKWCETMHFLGVVLALAFSVAWDQVCVCRVCVCVYAKRVCLLVAWLRS
jgi:hypothetical protein